MKHGAICAIGLLATLLAFAGTCAPPDDMPAPGSGALQRQLHRTRTELQRQRTQGDRLRAQVAELEHASAADRAQLDRRDREIAALERKLGARPAMSAPAPAGSH